MKLSGVHEFFIFGKLFNEIIIGKQFAGQMSLKHHKSKTHSILHKEKAVVSGVSCQWNNAFEFNE